MPDKVLGTMEIGRLIGVHHTTIGRWIDKGRLKGFTTLGGHRKVKIPDLVGFVKENGIPFPEELQDAGKVKVLVVDDDKTVLDVLAQGLRSHEEFRVETAGDGFEAGRVIERIRPDVVVLDIFLPGIDGFKVCEKIKNDCPHTKVIALTGSGSAEVKQMIRKAGADEYLEKPVDLQDLFSRINKLIQKTAGVNS